MFALKKILRPTLLSRTSRPAFVSSNIKDLERQLANNLKSEFQGEQLDQERESFINKFLSDNKWTLTASEDSTQLILTKKEAGHSIKVIYEAKLPEGPAEEDSENPNKEGAEGQQNYTEFVVVVDKNKPQKMLLDVVAVENEINLNGIVFSAEADKLAERNAGGRYYEQPFGDV